MALVPWLCRGGDTVRKAKQGLKWVGSLPAAEALPSCDSPAHWRQKHWYTKQFSTNSFRALSLPFIFSISTNLKKISITLCSMLLSKSHVTENYIGSATVQLYCVEMGECSLEFIWWKGGCFLVDITLHQIEPSSLFVCAFVFCCLSN